eukprot:186876-Hanusia_phi.AAC.2
MGGVRDRADSGRVANKDHQHRRELGSPVQVYSDFCLFGDAAGGARGHQEEDNWQGAKALGTSR